MAETKLTYTEDYTQASENPIQLQADVVELDADDNI